MVKKKNWINGAEFRTLSDLGRWRLGWRGLSSGACCGWPTPPTGWAGSAATRRSPAGWTHQRALKIIKPLRIISREFRQGFFVKGSKVRNSRDRNLTASWPGARNGRGMGGMWAVAHYVRVCVYMRWVIKLMGAGRASLVGCNLREKTHCEPTQPYPV